MYRVLSALVLSVPLVFGLAVRPAAATHERGGPYAPFVGTWELHGFSLEVTAGGTAYAVYRTYAWCGAQQRAGCDRMMGNHIYAGGLWAAYLKTPAGQSVGGVIGASADASLDGTAIRLVRAPHDVLLLTWGASGHRMQDTLCGPHVPPSLHLCGA
jgi:hypothetical protein